MLVFKLAWAGFVNFRAVTMRRSYLLEDALEFKRRSNRLLIWVFIDELAIYIVFDLSEVIGPVFYQRQILLVSPCHTLYTRASPLQSILHFLHSPLRLRHIYPLFHHNRSLIARREVLVDMHVFRTPCDIRLDNWLDLLVFGSSSIGYRIIDLNWLFISIKTWTFVRGLAVEIPWKLFLEDCILLLKYLFISVILLLFLYQVLLFHIKRDSYITVILLSFLWTCGTVGFA